MATTPNTVDLAKMARTLEATASSLRNGSAAIEGDMIYQVVRELERLRGSLGDAVVVGPPTSTVTIRRHSPRTRRAKMLAGPICDNLADLEANVEAIVWQFCKDNPGAAETLDVATQIVKQTQLIDHHPGHREIFQAVLTLSWFEPIEEG